ncbi:hypothetical protein EV421DRAFT_1466188 [Armillaria borealis]|uniref:Uncharacterized protein n=1 Tax=Armillaria borealis TaxID=47425 RepID=A0AA39MVG1_9AGAR|nr:hypothetical protein EV421DRAFT_1466188 [Armillaria borealis]
MKTYSRGYGIEGSFRGRYPSSSRILALGSRLSYLPVSAFTGKDIQNRPVRGLQAWPDQRTRSTTRSLPRDGSLARKGPEFMTSIASRHPLHFFTSCLLDLEPDISSWKEEPELPFFAVEPYLLRKRSLVVKNSKSFILNSTAKLTPENKTKEGETDYDKTAKNTSTMNANVSDLFLITALQFYLGGAVGKHNDGPASSLFTSTGSVDQNSTPPHQIYVTALFLLTHYQTFSLVRSGEHKSLFFVFSNCIFCFDFTPSHFLGVLCYMKPTPIDSSFSLFPASTFAMTGINEL